MSGGRVRITNVLIAVLVLAVLIVGVAVAFTAAYPQAARTLFTEVISGHPSLVVAFGRADALADSISRRAQEGWEYRFVGAYRRLTGEPSEPKPPPRDVFPEESCLQCHPFFRERPLFSVVYFSHLTHAANDLSCGRCHVASGPMRCVPPPMSGCGDCHTETARGGACNTCHPSGRLFHGAALAADREIGMQCVTCHLPRSLTDGAREMGLPEFDDAEETCIACHEQVFCGSCHPSGHPRNYVVVHATEFREGETDLVQCYECHSPTGCANCHTSARRR